MPKAVFEQNVAPQPHTLPPIAAIGTLRSSAQIPSRPT